MEVVEEPLDQEEPAGGDAGPLTEPAPTLPLPEPEIIEEGQREPPKKARAKAKPRAKTKAKAPEPAAPEEPMAPAVVVPKAKRAPRKPPAPEPPPPQLPTMEEMIAVLRYNQFLRAASRNNEYRSLVRM